jgi:hypothetical protein
VHWRFHAHSELLLSGGMLANRLMRQTRFEMLIRSSEKVDLTACISCDDLFSAPGA